jgi:GDP-L-fucose synthase
MRMVYGLAGKRVWVAGHQGMVGAAIMRRLAREDCILITAARSELDLKDQAAVGAFVERERPQAVFLAAAKVGGILANETFPADFLYDNLMIEANVVEASFRGGVEKLLVLGSSCVYPRLAPQPMSEDALLTGPLEPTHEWYAVAKIAGIKLAQAYRRQHGCDFISAVPTNLYGRGDNFDPATSHVMAALIRKAHEAKVRGDRQLVVWGTGTPRREFLYVDDCADALVLLMKAYSGPVPVNVGSGTDETIHDIARMVCAAVGFEGEIVQDTSKPDGPPRKLMSNDRLRDLGWSPAIGLPEGIADTYAAFLDELVGA